MAGETTYGGLAAVRNPSILAKEFLLLLKDRRAFRNHDALVYAGDAMGTGTATIKVGAMGLMGYDHLASVAEGEAVENTPIANESYSVTVARWAKRYSVTDLARLSDTYGVLTGPDTFARDAVISADVTLMAQIAAQPANFTGGTVGTAEDPFTVADFYAATALLEMNTVQGPYVALLHNRANGQFRQGLRTESGPMQWREPTAELLELRGESYKGSFLGVDIFTTDYIPTVNGGASLANGMWGRGAVIWADATIPEDVGGGSDRHYLGKVMVEFDRDSARGLKAVTTNFYFGVAKGISDCGVKILSKAAD